MGFFENLKGCSVKSLALNINKNFHYGKPCIYSEFSKLAFKKCQYVEIYVTLKQKIICAPFVKYRKSRCIRQEFDPKFLIHSLASAYTTNTNFWKTKEPANWKLIPRRKNVSVYFYDVWKQKVPVLSSFKSDLCSLFLSIQIQKVHL